MKVGFFHDHKFINKDGIIYTTGTLDSNVWNRFLDHNIDELIVCAREGETNSIDISKLAISSRDNVKFIFSPNLSNIRSLVSGYNKSIVEEAVRQVDVIVCRLPSEIGFAAIKFAKKYNKIALCEVVACPYDALSYHGSFLAKIYASVIKYRMKNSVKNCKGALYVTQSELQKRYPNLGINQNASNVELNEIKSDCIEVRASRFEERRLSGQLKFGLIGTMKNDTKGIDIAIKALTNKAATLHILGSGNPQRFIDMADKYNVSLKYDGFLSDKNAVFEWLDDIDIYLQPSYQEGLPRATIEAMSRGCIVLSSNAGGLPELVLPKYIHNSGDINKLASDIESLYTNLEPIHEIIHSVNVSCQYLSPVLSKKRNEFYGKFL